MKKQILGLVLSFLLLFLIGCQKAITTDIEAEVLSINSHVLNGELISNFLSSSSGSITNDTIKIGIKFKIGEYLFLEDLKLRHAELAYYKNSKTIPLNIKCRAGIGFFNPGNSLRIHLNGICKRHVRLSSEIAQNIFKIFQEEINAG